MQVLYFSLAGQLAAWDMRSEKQKKWYNWKNQIWAQQIFELIPDESLM